MAQSLVLSTAYYVPETDRRPTTQELAAVSRRISAGKGVVWDEEVITKLMAEQETLERAGSPGWARIILLIGVLLLLMALPVALAGVAIAFMSRP